MSNRRSRNRRQAACVAVLLALGVALPGSPRPAAAQSPEEDPCLRDAACQRLLARAQAASQDRRFDDALATYERAYESSKAPWLLVNVGRMQHKLARYADARQSYLRYLEQPRQPGDEEQQATATDFLSQTESQLKQQSALTGTAPAPPPPEKRPLYKKWWLWTVVGGVVAGGVAGTIAGVYATRSSLPSVPPEAQVRPFE